MDAHDHPRRRLFLIASLGGLGTALAALTGWPLFRYLAPSSTQGANKNVSLAKKDVVQGKANFFQYQGKPAVIVEPKPGEYQAMSAVCTHLGCIVKWNEEDGEFVCPCHGGRFSDHGEVLGGPPPEDLAAIPVAVDGDTLTLGEVERT